MNNILEIVFGTIKSFFTILAIRVSWHWAGKIIKWLDL